MANEEIIYVGSGWENQYGLKISLKLDKIKDLSTNQYGDIKLEVVRRKAVDEKSKATHFVKVDTYVKGSTPTKTYEKVDSFDKQINSAPPVRDNTPIGYKEDPTDDMPF